MIFPSNRVRIVVATKPVDFRKGHDGLAALVKNELRKEPFTGTVFVFRSKRADRLKLLYWDGTGLVMAYKRLEEHTFTWPAIRDGVVLEPCAAQSAVLRSRLAQSAGGYGASADCGRVNHRIVLAGAVGLVLINPPHECGGKSSR
jgi:transposase